MVEKDEKANRLSQLNNSIKLIYKCIITIVSILTAVYFGIRIYNGVPFSLDAGVWGAVGDFFGGILNPFFAILTIYLLVKSLRLQSEELADATAQLSDTKQIHANSLLYESTKLVFEKRAGTINLLPNLTEYKLKTKNVTDGAFGMVSIASHLYRKEKIVFSEDNRSTLAHLLASLDLELIDFAQAGLDLFKMGVPSYIIRDKLGEVHPRLFVIESNLESLKYDDYFTKGFSMYKELYTKAGVQHIL